MTTVQNLLALNLFLIVGKFTDSSLLFDGFGYVTGCFEVGL